MLNLDMKTRVEPLEVPSELKESFPYPLIFYAINDNYRVLNEFKIVDFQNSQIIYIDLYSDQNKKLIQEKLGPHFLNVLPHAITPVNPQEDFYCFPWVFPKGNHYAFQYVNFKKELFQLYTNKDFGDNFGAGSDGSSRDGNSFYIAFHRTDKPLEEGFKVSLDLSKREKIYEASPMNRPPHELFRFDNYLILSSFNNNRQFKTIGGGQIISGDDKLNEFLDKYPDSDFEAMPGEFHTISLKTGERRPWLIGNTPSHVEIDGDNLYFNCCNMGVFRKRLCYVGNASIAKVKFTGDWFINWGSVSSPTFFRGTSHTFFKQDNTPYVASMGFPNRIFIFNMETMDLDFFYDINGKILKDTYSENRQWLNFKHDHQLSNEHGRLALKASPDGKYILFFNFDHVGFLNLKTRTVEHNIPYKTEEGFYGRPHHCYYMR